jgi:hypothetical protein
MDEEKTAVAEEDSTIDMDAARAARREAEKVTPTVRFGGQSFVLPVELPVGVLRVARDLTKGTSITEMADVTMEMARVLLGDEQYARFENVHPSFEDLDFFLRHTLATYGVTLGESSASTGRSRRTSPGSRQRSKPSTP